jgi:poly-gamma-glutamate capsule biosynthesis protein CapA/YwtB (metallophosphatase superfamily)
LLSAAGKAACPLFLLLACAPRPTEPTRFWFGGDVHLGHHGAEVLRSLGLRGAGVVNLEGPIAAGDASSSRLVNGPQTAQALAQDGVRVAWIDNNHALDVGPDGPARTRTALEHAGIDAAGTAQLGRTVFVGADLAHGVPADLAARLDAVKADTLIAGFHVTAEATLLPTPELEAAVALALQHGARIVVAHGTHAIARVERRDEAVIAWGLGNLAFDCDCTDARDGLALEVDIDGPFINAWAVPVSAGLHGAPATLSVQPDLMFDLLRSLDSSALTREGARARF